MGQAVIIIVSILAGLIVVDCVITFANKRKRHAGPDKTNKFIDELLVDNENTTYAKTLFPHPYLAFVHNKSVKCNNIGLFGHDFPFTKNDKVHTILLTGGSVACQFGTVYGRWTPRFETYLNNHYRDSQGRKFFVLNAADGGWKQPQQAIALLLYNDIIDSVICLDGFNESFCFRSTHRIEYPAVNFHLANPVAVHSQDTLLWMYLAEKAGRFWANNVIFKYSGLANMLAEWFTQRCSSKIKKNLSERKDEISIESIFAGPDNNAEYNMLQYMKYILTMKAISNYYSINHVHFIQPVPAIGKKLTKEELALAGDLSYKETYQEMAQKLLNLRKSGVNIYSLLNIFNGIEEKIYADTIHCHFETQTGNSLGYGIMSEAIGKIIAQMWRFQPLEAPATTGGHL